VNETSPESISIEAQTPPQNHSRGLYRFAQVTVVSVFMLIFAGGLVTSTGSGLSVPDWPLSFGKIWPEMTGGVFYEHGHRTIATGVGILTVVLAIWLWKIETRRWLRNLGFLAVIAVIAQGVLGGLTVLLKLPPAVSVSHATLAQSFFCLVIIIAMALSPSWNKMKETGNNTEATSSVPKLTMIAAIAVFVQLILGATMRHLGAGLAIPDFPLALGKVIPPLDNHLVLIHFMHRVGAVVVAALIIITAASIHARHRDLPQLTKPASILSVLVLVQIGLGGATVLTLKNAHTTTTHVAVGALILGISVFLAVRAHLCLETRSAS